MNIPERKCIVCGRNYKPNSNVQKTCGPECKKVLMLAKVGKKNGCLIEGMACPGGCVAGAGTCIGIPQATKAVNTFKAESDVKIPSMDAMKQEEIE